VSQAGRAAEELVETARSIAAAGPICDECLGRAFGRSGRGLSNGERGAALRLALSLFDAVPVEGVCWVCGGLFDRVAEWADRAASEAEDVQFRTYRFGVRLTPRLEEMERYFNQRFPTEQAESLKHAFNREVGKRFDALFAEKTVSFDAPDLSFLVDLEAESLTLHIASIFVYGRYRKMVRGIPQTRWPCRKCRGRGCERCGFTGKQYPTSVEELVAPPLVEAAAADDDRFHGAGREDIDALMLGSGRPFVLELLAPRRRGLDLSVARAEIERTAAGKVEVSGLSFTTRKTVELVKETRARKRYRMRVGFAGDVERQAFDGALADLVGSIEQRTPARVVHRRADLVRRRQLLEATGRLTGTGRAEIEVLTEGGLYVKELISGDGGRTRPSLSSELGVEAKVIELDVVDVISSAFPDDRVDIANGLT